ncbi:MAG: ABC transporter ATP-binding protein [Lachnospiraceae bacterium]|nr:ABC transporter ATP-binding protein [uncultured Acetatifactor sp.]MCI8790174.1 ABC transporter ATP-binding protein [Lachnospiraceae bacterium]
MKDDTGSERKRSLSAIWHFIRLGYRIYPGYFPLAVLSAVTQALSPFLGIVMPRYILNELVGERRIQQLVLWVAILILGNALVGIAGSVIGKKLQVSGEKLADGFELHVGRHIMHMDFEKLEDAKILDMKEKALFNIRLHDALLGGPRTILSIFQLTITLIGVVGMIAVLNPVLIAVLLMLIAVNVWVYRRIQSTKMRFYQDIAVYNRRFQYFLDLTQDFKNAKDVRLYRMSEYIINRINNHTESVNRIFYKMFLKQRHHDGLSAGNIQAQTFAAYAFAAWGVFRGTVRIGDFTMYISAANQFSSAATQLMAKLVDLQMLGKVLQDYLAFERLPSGNGEGERILCTGQSAWPAPLPSGNGEEERTAADLEAGSLQIEFRNVWFRYPNAEDYALKDVSLTIRPGEKLSIVGRNGSGKTTLIKLLCRLYRPQQGAILLNGVDINEFQETAYHRLLSVLFQDYKIFSFSAGENLAFQEKADADRIRAALSQAGVLEKIEELPRGIDTPLYKNFDKDGAELSGGEMQKIAIARALYKDAAMVVLDEPTAALDPYSEYQVFSQFEKMAQGKTTIYIFHRLSSCRFCDAVAVFDNGALVEYGSHEQLVRAEKLYARMWEAQAQYYQ